MQLFLENTWRRDDSGVTLRCHWAAPLSTGHRHQLWLYAAVSQSSVTRSDAEIRENLNNF